MTTDRTVRIKVEADTFDALRKLREVGREARRTRRRVEGGWGRLDAVMGIALSLLALGNGLYGLITHSAFYVASACLFLLMARSD